MNADHQTVERTWAASVGAPERGVLQASLADMARDIDLAARSSVNVLITTASDTNRVVCARAIHDRSARRARPFVAVRGAGGPEGAVHAADVDRWFDRATGGTLFIDEIGELGSAAQARLFSRLNQPVRRAIGPRRYADRRARLIAGSNRALRLDGTKGGFCEPLFYRINVIHIVGTRPDGAGVHA